MGSEAATNKSHYCNGVTSKWRKKASAALTGAWGLYWPLYYVDTDVSDGVRPWVASYVRHGAHWQLSIGGSLGLVWDPESPSYIGGRGPDQKLYSVSSAKQPAGATGKQWEPCEQFSICVSAPSLVTHTERRSVRIECTLECQCNLRDVKWKKCAGRDYLALVSSADKMSAESDSGCAGLCTAAAWPSAVCTLRLKLGAAIFWAQDFTD